MSRVPLHPEAVPGDPATVRWAVPAGLLGMVGPVGAAPEPLDGLRAGGTVRVMVAEPAALRITLGAGRSWRADGARVREALEAALQSATAGEGAFLPDTVPVVSGLQAGARGPGRDGATLPAAGTGDDVLRAAVVEVLTGPVGDYLRSHGGSADLVTAEDGAVTLALGGTCDGCPARGFTVHARLEGEIRRLYPELRSVDVV